MSSIPTIHGRNPAVLLGLLPAALLAAACGGSSAGPSGPSGPPLTIDSIVPGNADTLATYASPIRVYFSEAVDAGTLTSSSLELLSGGATIPAAVSYDATIHSATLAALLPPGANITVDAKTSIHSTGGRALTSEVTSLIVGRSLAVTTVDSDGTVGSHASLALDPSGGAHVLYGGPISGVKFATCASQCTTASNWLHTFVDSGGIAVTGGLVRDGSGVFHAIFWESDALRLRYAECSAGCGTLANWTKATIDSQVYVGGSAVLGRTSNGRLHVLFFNSHATPDFRYVRCASGCTDPSHWTSTRVNTTSGLSPSLAVGPDDRLHFAYYDASAQRLTYSTCAANCGLAASWSQVAVDHAGDLGVYPALGIGPNGAVHIAYSPDASGRSDVGYLHCEANCTSSAGWTSGRIVASGALSAEKVLAVGADGQVHVLMLVGNQQVYARCGGACLSPATWVHGPFSRNPAGNFMPTIALDAGAGVHATFTDGTLKYAEYP